MPSQQGMVTEIRVKEGQLVNAGEVLFVLDNERASATKGDAAQVITALLTARRDSLSAEQGMLNVQVEQKQVALQRRLDNMAAQLQRINEQIALQQRRTALADQAVTRFRKLYESNFISAAGLQEKEAELIDQQARLADLQRAQVSLRQDQDAIKADLADITMQAKRDAAAVQRNVDAIEQDLTENEARRRLLVRAPQAGMVSGITTQVGQTIAANQIMANISPQDSPLEAELYAPSRSSGFVKPGMTVLIRYQAYPYQKFGQFNGKVREVTHSPLSIAPESNQQIAGGGKTEPPYRIRVQLEQQSVKTYGQEQRLKPGMALDASILLEQRKLYEWVLEPLYSISGKI